MGGCWVGVSFIIVFYVEMYGFLLMIYLLVWFFGLDSDYVSVNLWVILIGLGEIGMLIFMLFGYVFVFIGIGLYCFWLGCFCLLYLFIIGWCSERSGK